MRFCTNCGKKINSNTRFCPYCGAKQPVTSQPAQGQPTRSMNQPNYHTYRQAPQLMMPMRPKSHHKKLITWIVIIVILIVGFIGYKHSELSINLNSEIPNNTWTLSTNKGAHATNIRFHSDNMSGNVSSGTSSSFLKDITIRPSGRHTATFKFHTVTDYGDTVTGNLPMTVTGGNENNFRLSNHDKGTLHVDGHTVTIKNGKGYVGNKEKSLSPSLKRDFNIHFHLIKK